MKSVSWSTLRIKGQPTWPRCDNCNNRYFAMSVRLRADGICSSDGRMMVPVALIGKCSCGYGKAKGYCTAATWKKAVKEGKFRRKPKN